METLSQVTRMRDMVHEVIVVDNGSEDGTPDAVYSAFRHVKLIRLDRNIGAAGYNCGFRTATGKYVVVLDDDSFPSQEALQVAFSFLEQHPDVGVLAGNVYNTRLGVWEAEKFFGGRLPAKAVEVPSFIGCGAIIRRAVLEKVGGYNEELFLYWNEDEFALRVLSSGMRLVFHPMVVFTHRSSSANRTSARTLFYMLRNSIWFARNVARGLKLYSYLVGLALIWLRRIVMDPRLTGTYVRALGEGMRKTVSFRTPESEVDLMVRYLDNLIGLPAVLRRGVLRLLGLRPKALLSRLR